MSDRPYHDPGPAEKRTNGHEANLEERRPDARGRLADRPPAHDRGVDRLDAKGEMHAPPPGDLVDHESLMGDYRSRAARDPAAAHDAARSIESPVQRSAALFGVSIGAAQAGNRDLAMRSAGGFGEARRATVEPVLEAMRTGHRDADGSLVYPLELHREILDGDRKTPATMLPREMNIPMDLHEAHHWINYPNHVPAADHSERAAGFLRASWTFALQRSPELGRALDQFSRASAMIPAALAKRILGL